MKAEQLPPKKHSPKTIVNAAVSKLGPLLKSENMTESASGQKKGLERMNLGLFRLVVMGEIKKGKSSFINALLEEPELLPTDVDIATSTVYKIIYGPNKRFKIFFQEDPDTGKRPVSIEVKPSQISEYGTEKGNPENHKCVDFIGIELPSPLLKDGLCIIDTPGVGGLYKSHRDITWRYAPNADAVFFILDSTEAVLSSDEILFLRELVGEVTKRVYFAQTKTDAADVETVQAWEKRNKSLLAKEVGIPDKNIRYFPVSSLNKFKADKTYSGKKLVRSGFPPLLHFLNHVLIPAKDTELARDAAQLLLCSSARLENALQERHKIFSRESDEEAKGLQLKFGEAKKSFAEWGKEIYPRVVNNFTAEYDTLRMKTRRAFKDELSPHGHIITDILKPFDKLSVADLLNETENAGKKLMAKTAAVSSKISREFAIESKELAFGTTSKLAENSQFSLPEFQKQHQSEFNKTSSPINLKNKASGWDKTREVVGGASIGSVILGTAVTLAFPAIAIPALMLGLTGGGAIAYDNIEKREKKQLLNELEGKLKEKLLQVREKALDDFDEETSKFHRQFQDLLRETKEGRERELSARMTDLADSQKLELSRRKEKTLEINHALSTVREVIHSLTSLFPSNE